MIRIMRGARRLLWLSALVASAGLSDAVADPVRFQFFYLDPQGVGFNDPAHGAQARAFLEAAGQLWGARLEASYPGETVRIDASYTALVDGAQSETASFTAQTATARLASGIYYPVALLSQLHGEDARVADRVSTRLANDADIALHFGINTSFSYADEAPPPGALDFFGTALHEIGHGLGFVTHAQPSGAFLEGPTAYDEALIDASGRALVAMGDAQRQAALAQGRFFWGGANATAENGGLKPQLLAVPGVYSPGTSLIHTDLYRQTGATDGVMESCSFSGATRIPCTLWAPREIDAVTLGMLADLGWAVAPAPEASTLVLFLAGVLGAGAVRWRRTAQRAARALRRSPGPVM